MRILHLSSEKSWRGGEQQIAYLIDESRGADIAHFVLSRQESQFSDWCASHGVQYMEAGFSGSLDMKTARTVKRACREWSIDLIHLHSGKSHGIYALATLIGVDTPAVLSRRVDFPVKRNPWARWKYGLNQIKAILCVSDAIRDMIAPAIKNPQRCVTVHSGIDLSRFDRVQPIDLRTEYGIPKDKLLIANVAALAPHKDYATFIAAAGKAIASGLQAHFLIIGDGPQRDEISESISAADLGTHITMTGFREDIPQVLRSLDIFFITSETEGLGTSILDAFASGLPVVATAAGGIPESVIHEKTGLLCAVKDSDCLANALIRLSQEEGLSKRLTSGAEEHLKQFTKQATAQKTVEIYRRVLSV